MLKRAGQRHLLKSTDYRHFTTRHYGDFSKLGFRKSYNDFAEPAGKKAAIPSRGA